MSFNRFYDGIAAVLRLLVSRRFMAAGVSIVELVIALSIFAVLAVGAFSALTVFDQIQSQQTARKNTFENQRRDFLQAYDRILKFQDPTPAISDNGLMFLTVPTHVQDCRYVEVTDDGQRLTFYTNDNTSREDAVGCPAHTVFAGIQGHIENMSKPIFFGLSSTGKICEGRFLNESNFDTSTSLMEITVTDNECLKDVAGNFMPDNGTIIFPEYLIYDREIPGKPGKVGGDVNTAIFFPFDRLTEPTLAQCGITSNLETPITGFDIDGDPDHDSDDMVMNATITISGGFDMSEDRLYIKNATDSPIFSSTTNGVGDVIHTYTNVHSGTVAGFPPGVTLSTATYNAAQGFMLLTATASVSPDIWEDVFNEIIYINLDNADDNASTVFNPVDKQIIFSLGEYPARQVDGDFHFYHFEDCAASNCITWDAAYDDAADTANKHLGLDGYLATVTSEEENIFISDRARSQNGAVTTWAAGWLGGTGDLSDTKSDGLCSDITGASRDLGNWYWVTGKPGQEKCTLFWQGWAADGKTIGVDGNVIQHDKVNPNATTAWNCDNANGPNDGNVIATMSDGYSLRESWWYDNRSGRDNTSIRYANWSGGSTLSSTCVFSADWIGEPNNCCDNGEHYLQMTGLPSGRRLWNDLYGDTYSNYNPGRWYEVRGYFAEWDTSQADPDTILARAARLNTRRHAELCLPVQVAEQQSTRKHNISSCDNLLS